MWGAQNVAHTGAWAKISCTGEGEICREGTRIPEGPRSRAGGQARRPLLCGAERGLAANALFLRSRLTHAFPSRERAGTQQGRTGPDSSIRAAEALGEGGGEGFYHLRLPYLGGTLLWPGPQSRGPATADRAPTGKPKESPALWWPPRSGRRGRRDSGRQAAPFLTGAAVPIPPSYT